MCLIDRYIYFTSRLISLLYVMRIILHLFIGSLRVAIHPCRGRVAFSKSQFCTNLRLVSQFTRIVFVYFICDHLFTYQLGCVRYQIFSDTFINPKSMTVFAFSFVHNHQYLMATFSQYHFFSFRND